MIYKIFICYVKGILQKNVQLSNSRWLKDYMFTLTTETFFGDQIFKHCMKESVFHYKNKSQNNTLFKKIG